MFLVGFIKSLLALDVPVGSVARLELICQMKPSTLSSLSGLPLIKVLQSVVLLLSSNAAKNAVSSQQDPSLPTAVEKLVSLTTFTPNVSKATVTETNARAVRSNAAETNEAFWNKGAVTPPDGIISEGWMMVNGEYDDSLHGVIFRFLRRCMARIFARNVTRSFRRFLSATYQPDECKICIRRT